MVLEVAVLNVIPEKMNEFESSFVIAQEIIQKMRGYKGHQLQKCIEVSNRYLLLVNWDTLEDHTIGFRQSQEYLEWKTLLHHFYDPFPSVDHYEKLF